MRRGGLVDEQAAGSDALNSSIVEGAPFDGFVEEPATSKVRSAIPTDCRHASRAPPRKRKENVALQVARATSDDLLTGRSRTGEFPRRSRRKKRRELKPLSSLPKTRLRSRGQLPDGIAKSTDHL